MSPGYHPAPNGSAYPPQPIPAYPPPQPPATGAVPYRYSVPYNTHPYVYSYPQPPPGSYESSPPAPAPPPAHDSASSSSASGKRKRDDDLDADASEAEPTSATTSQPSQRAQENKKRTKTQRACDSCRSRKIRCDVLPDTEPPLCQHCKQYGFECTFFLPIAETRFKKKKLEEEQAAADRTRHETEQRGSSTPQADARVFGPTSEAHLLHSSATIPSKLYESYDARHHHSWELGRAGDGLINVLEPARDGAASPAAPRPPADMRIERDVVERLLNAYFSDIAPVLPIVTQAEFLATPSPPPILLYSMCLVAAARRNVPQSTFDSIRYIVNAIIKSEDVLSTASIVNVQALLILCMVGDCHSQFVPNALSAMWVRLGTAIRMAQDLGLHRAEAIKQNIELRRRLWCMCVISDRWMSLSYGHPYMIDINDCDARFPSSGSSDDMYTVELVRLSILLGRVLKTIYSPSGLNLATDEALVALLNDIESWRANLPPSLQFHGPSTPRQSGLLFLLYSCLCMIFWRVFMRLSYTCPAHLKFQLTVEKWSVLVKLTGDAIDWLDHHDSLYDVWMFVAYAATSCALVQYHTWARRQDQVAAQKLKTLRDCIRRWEKSLSPDHMSARRKTAEIIALLYEATQGPPPSIERPALTPTTGVQLKEPPPEGAIAFQSDASRPGGGVFVARDDAAREMYKDIPTGVFDSEGTAGSAGHAAPAPEAAAPPPASLVSIMPLTPRSANVNPALNMGTSGTDAGSAQTVEVVNPLGELERLTSADSSWLESIPGGMFDWGQWDEFFSKLGSTGAGPAGGTNGTHPFMQPAGAPVISSAGVPAQVVQTSPGAGARGS
ncbi:fungal-specific transcription factor domain-containing protein [Vararia minispora EC-137]|uniref:Fungal-specific transcription factor domain-containing protein n=1 Tax=Vararia minispora EC-137 TaxID=1314806 RepID=A0ACB8QKT2_9AGAM|nr:fungal-specific transcription factor domain-containing protein [Vararia minispora EC-137]